MKRSQTVTMDLRLYSRYNVYFLFHLQYYVHRSFLFNDFNKENKTCAYSFETSSFSIAVVSFSMHITLIVLQIASLHFHTVTPSIKFAATHLYTWVERGTVRFK